MKKFTLDARDIPCPRPLLKTKETMEKEDFTLLEVLVNNAAARENVCRFLKKSGMDEVEWTEQAEEAWTITAKRPAPAEAEKSGTPPEKAPRTAPQATPEDAAGKVLLISSDRIGRGDDTLGALLMKGFLYTLTQLDSPPACLIFMNSGVRLACDGSESLEDLRALETGNCRILVCGTCLDYYGLGEQRQVGSVSNMYDIAGELMDHPRTITLG